LIAQKNIGPLVLAYNVTLEAAWQGKQLDETQSELQQSLGESYEFKHFSVSAEIVHEIEIPDWQRGQRPFLFGGPNVSIRAGKWCSTVTALAQLTRAGDEPDIQVRTIVGYSS
jgi:hypothetical protein